MIIIDGLIDLIVDYNLIFFIPDVQEDTSFVPALCFSHEVLAILHGSEQYSYAGVEVIKGLNKRKRTMRASAA